MQIFYINWDLWFSHINTQVYFPVRKEGNIYFLMKQFVIMTHFSRAMVDVKQGAFSRLHKLTLNELTPEDGMKLVKSKGSNINVSSVMSV